MSVRYDAIIASPLPGALRIGIVMAEEGVASIDFLPADRACQAPSGAAVVTVAALQAYFAEPHQGALPALAPSGTPFQRRVWAALCAIPAGETRTYGALAKALGSGARAVAGACRRNPVPILVPCHRVVAAAGWGGYMGHTDGPELLLKRWLLDHERNR